MATVLKAEEFNRNDQKKRVFNFQDVAAEVKMIIENAQSRADELIEQAREKIQNDLEQAKKEGYQQGLDKGLVEGREQGNKEALTQGQEAFNKKSNDTINSLKKSLEQFDEIKKELLFQAEQSAVDLAIRIARKVTKITVTQNPEVTVANVRAALDMASRSTNVIIKLNGDDVAHFEEMKSNNEAILGSFKSIKIEQDKDISRGSCMVITEQGVIDAQLEKQIDRIADELLMTNGTKDKK